MSKALGDASEDAGTDVDPEDTVNAALEARMAARKMLTNASYFAFTATPKNKTLEMFGEALPLDAEGKIKHRPFHSIDMDSYRVEKKKALDIPLPDADAEIGPIPVEGGGHKPEPQLDRLSQILDAFNAQFGTLFTDSDRVTRRIREDIAPKVASDPSYQNAKANTPSTARLEHDKALAQVMLTLLKDDTEVYKQFVQNDAFKRAVSDMVYAMTQSTPSPAA